MVAIVSFLMHGSKILDSFIASIPNKNQHPSGDVISISKHLLMIC
jgi:hypothetical protein